MIFGWISAAYELPARLDLRPCGWTLCDAELREKDIPSPCSECRHVLLVEAADLSQAERLDMLAAERTGARLLMIGVEDAEERAQLIAGGCGDALPAGTSLRELAARARRQAEVLQLLPRRRAIGPLTLDMFHRDGRIEARWLGLHPREFSLLWRLTDRPGERVTRAQLLRDVWRLDRDPETNSVEVHISRLRGKLARLGHAALIETVPTGGYRIAANLCSVERGSSMLDDEMCGDRPEAKDAEAGADL